MTISQPHPFGRVWKFAIFVGSVGYPAVNLLAYVRIIVLVQHTETRSLETVISDVLSCLSVTCR